MIINNLSSKQFDNYKKQRYAEIYQHELAHKQKGGALAGSIVIEKDKNGIPFQGHVDIKMPSLDKNNPQNTIKDAKTVISSALAPSNPSNQDYKVAFQAKKILSQAQNLENQRKLDYFA